MSQTAVILFGAAALAASPPPSTPPSVGPGVTIEGRFAADPDGVGPPAWRWLRSDLLPSLQSDVDARHAFLATWSAGEVAAVRFDRDAGATPLPEGIYASFRISIEGRSIGSGRCAWNGHAVWSIEEPEALPARLSALCDLGALCHFSVARTLDIATLAGLLSPVAAGAVDPASRLTTSGATECGEVRFVAEPRGNGFTVSGVSGGGLLLPTIIALVAETANSTARLEAIETSRSVTEQERWRMLAFAGRDGMRNEAAAQLGRLASPADIATLERLLWSDPAEPGITPDGERIRGQAMDGLIRAGAGRSLAKIVRAGQDAGRAIEADLGTAAIQSLWESAPADVRDQVLDQRPELGATSASRPAAPSRTERGQLRPTILALSGISMILLLGVYTRAARSGQSSGSPTA